MLATLWRAAAAAIGMTLLSAPVLSDVYPPLEEVVVTAQKREQKLQDVPLSMSALSAVDFEDKGLVGFRDWANYVPGIEIAQGSGANRRAGPTATIRGVSQTGAGQENEVAAMATTSYTLGQVPLFSGDPSLFDMNRIEVLRGPQGTLFGIASMGGTVRYIPNEAQINAFSGSVGAGGGSYQHGGYKYDLDFVVNVPVVENVLAFRLAAETRHSDGFINIYGLPLTMTDFTQIRVDGTSAAFRPTSGPGITTNANSTSSTAARLSVTYAPTERLQIKAFAMWQKQLQTTRQDIDYNDASQSWVATRFSPEPQNNELRLTSAEASYDVGFGTLNYVFGSQHSSQLEALDFTAITALLLTDVANALQVNPNLPADPYPSITSFPFSWDDRITSNEIRLQGVEKSLGFKLAGTLVTIDYVLGYFNISENKSGTWEVANPTWNQLKGPNTAPILTAGGLVLGGIGGGGYDSNAGFADLVFNLGKKLSIGGGVRYSDSKRTSAERRYGDLFSGVAVDGATVGDNLAGPGVAFEDGSAKAHFVTPRFTANYKFDADRMLYFTASKGQRLPSSYPTPDFFVGSLPQCVALATSLGLAAPALNGTKTDTVRSLDLGLRSLWLDRRLVANVSIYHLKWTDFQLNVLLNSFDAACQEIIAANVGAVDIKGFELETLYSPVENVTLTSSVAYTDAGLSQDIAGVTSSLGTPLRKGDSVTDNPPWTVAAGAEYRFTLPSALSIAGEGARGFARVDWRYVGERFDESLGNKDALRADPGRSLFVAAPYQLTDVRLGVRSKEWSGSLYASNVFDKRAMYASHQYSWYPNQRVVSVSAPRTIGFELRRRF